MLDFSASPSDPAEEAAKPDSIGEGGPGAMPVENASAAGTELQDSVSMGEGSPESGLWKDREWARSPERIWSVALVLAVSIFAGIATATVCTVLLVIFQDGFAGLSEAGKVQGVGRTRLGFLTLSIAPQLAMAAVAIVAAWFSPRPFRDRLLLRPPSWPPMMVVVGAVATPMVGVLSAAFFGMFLSDSENLKQISEVFRDLGSGPFAIAIAAVIGLTPGLCEEILFRGYAQTRLIHRFGPRAGWVLASMLFAAFHIDPVHAISVFPLGLYLGFLAHRSGSIWPSVAGHTLNNALAVGLILTAPADPNDPPTTGAMMLASAVFFLGGPACLYMLYWTVRQRADAPAESTSGTNPC